MAAVKPDFCLRQRRQKTLADEPEAQKLTDAGVFKDTVGCLRCFHCGLKYQGGRCSAKCQLYRLLQCASPSDEQTAQRLSSASAKLLKLLEQPALEFVVGFGFSRRSVDFAVARQFMTSNKVSIDKPGNIIGKIYDCLETLDSELVENFDVRQLLLTSVRRQESSSDAQQQQQKQQQQQQQEQQQPEREPAQGKRAPTSESSKCGDDSRCHVCRSQQLDHLVLPCAHFVLCGDCVPSAKKCPKCQEPIRATFRAFVA